jgi:bifunctional enzyme CysN/CysC
MDTCRDQLNIVIVGHVDHGKSTLIGRLLADTKSLPEGKLQQVQDNCKRNSKVFEYAYLLDALKDEQRQGITIDSARCFFKTKKRDYIIIDAPGHIEFLKNMISGASRAQAALLVIDANEGIQENSRRHGFMLSMLGIKQVIVCVNKMDLVNYSKLIFDKIQSEYSEFLAKSGIKPLEFIPISAINGTNLISRSKLMPWHKGHIVLTAVDSFQGAKTQELKPFRMPVQDIYKFTGFNDDRRIIAGRVESGTIKIGDKVQFSPSQKHSRIKTIEEFNAPKRKKISAGYSTGFTLTEQLYIQPGELMYKPNEKPVPEISSIFKANVFWMGKAPLTLNKEYKFKIATNSTTASIRSINKVLDASNLSSSNKKQQVNRHEVAECIIETSKPIALDYISDFEVSGRFVLVDNYEISGGGIIVEAIKTEVKDLKKMVTLRDVKWEKSDIPLAKRIKRFAYKPRLILVTGRKGLNKVAVAKKLEALLFDQGVPVYYIGIRNVIYGVDADIKSTEKYREEHIRRLAEVIHILLSSGMTVIATASDLNEDHLNNFRTILGTKEITTITIGKSELLDKKTNLVLDEKQSTKTSAEIIKAYYFDRLKSHL